MDGLDRHSRRMNPIGRAVERVGREVRARQIAAALADRARFPTILCASTGRVASNMLHRSIVEGRARSILGSFTPSDAALIGSINWDLSRNRIRPGTICKTHDLPYALGVEPALKVVFSFGKPSDIVLSVFRKVAADGQQWGERHLRNMHASGGLDDLAERDILRLEEQIDAWREMRRLPLLAIHYDALCGATALLSDFLGFPVTLLAQRPRRPDGLDAGLVARVRASYARLDDKVARLPKYWRTDA